MTDNTRHQKDDMPPARTPDADGEALRTSLMRMAEEVQRTEATGLRDSACLPI